MSSASLWLPAAREKPPVGSRVDMTHPAAAGLVGCWLMNDGGGGIVHNAARNGLNGTITSGAASAPTTLGKGLLFSANTGGVQVPNLPPLDINSTYPNFSIEIWFAANPGDDAINETLWNKTGSNNSYIWVRMSGSGTVLTRLWDNSNFNDLTGTIAVDGNLHQLVIVRDKSGTNTFRMYWDGRLLVSVTDTSVSANVDTAGNPLWIGADRLIADRFFAGKIALARWWQGRALPPAAVRQLFVEPFGMFATRQKAWAGLVAAAGKPYYQRHLQRVAAS